MKEDAMTTPNDATDPDVTVARVHYLPGVSDTEIIDAEIETPEDYRAYQKRTALAVAHSGTYKRDAVTVYRAVTHDRSKTAGKAIARHAWYPIAGAGLVAKHVWEAKTNSRYERAMRAAESKGDWDKVADWDDRGEQARERRHKRHMDWLTAPQKLVKALVIAYRALIGFLLALGIVIALANKDISDVLGPIKALMTLAQWIAWVVAIVWGPLVLLAPYALVIALHHVGRKAEAAPSWLLAAKDATATGGTLITADAIVNALRYLGIGRLNEAIKKEGWKPRFELVPIREGQGAFKGYRAIFDLPDGVTPEHVADKGAVLAKNLHRNPVEVWPSNDGQKKGGKPGYINLYVADSGVMDKPTPEYPLMHDGTADVFAGVPVGITQRGDVVPFPLVGSNFVFGGQPGQGKSNGARVVMLGAALDPIAELRVHVFANNGDFDAYERRLSLYKKGATPEHVEMATEHLRWMHEEVARREQRLADLGAKKLTRALAEKYPDLRPIVTLFSECHELFGKSEDAAELAVDVVKRGRKTGIICGFDTQSSRANAIPSQLVENIGINGCFAVKTWRSNDGFLGDGSFSAGIRATELRFNVDRGTMVATGVSEELFEIVRTFFVEVNDDTGYDAAAEVIDRAMAQIAEGTPLLINARPSVEPVEDRDLLEDVAEVLDSDPVPAAQVADALKAKFPRWAAYQTLTGKRLGALLDREYGVKVPSTGNKWPVDPVTVRERLAQLATADLDDEG